MSRQVTGALPRKGRPIAVQLTTPLPPDECRERLKKCLRRSPLLLSPGDKWVGWVKGDAFALWPSAMGKFTGVEIAHRLTGTLAPWDGGTRIKGVVTLHPVSLFVLAFTAIVATAATALGAVAMASRLFDSGMPQAVRSWLVPAFAVSVARGVIVAYSARRSRGDTQRMLSLLQRELHAELQPVGGR
jgi:hypothetical protein